MIIRAIAHRTMLTVLLMVFFSIVQLGSEWFETFRRRAEFHIEWLEQ
jgi:hypothetical protein